MKNKPKTITKKTTPSIKRIPKKTTKKKANSPSKNRSSSVLSTKKVLKNGIIKKQNLNQQIVIKKPSGIKSSENNKVKAKKVATKKTVALKDKSIITKTVEENLIDAEKISLKYHNKIKVTPRYAAWFPLFSFLIVALLALLIYFVVTRMNP